MNRDHTREKGKIFFPLAFSLFPLIILATANSAGYRYGASDLAFYGPAVMRHLDPQLFPRDRPILDAQARLTLMDETVGTLARLTTTNLPLLFLILYLVSLILLAAGAAAVGERLYQHQWSTGALLIALSLRHAIPRSGTNTLESYFHPRQLAFAFGVLAVAAFLRGRMPFVVAALLGAALLHPTTTLWFAIWLGVAAFVSESRWRIALGSLAVLGSVAIAWAALWGPLTGRLMVMDREWLSAIADKDYLFPSQWPLSTWLLNLGYALLIWLIHRHRARSGLVRDRETALVVGCLSLLLVFLTAAVLNAMHVALAIQLQPARVFWLLDFLALIYVVWVVAESGSPSLRRPAAAALLVLVLALVRGVYVMRVEFPDRPLFEVRVPGDWGRVMAWARTKPADAGWLADPNHAALYGTSVRMAAGRDVFVEGMKDAAIGMYDRSIALRTRERLQEIRDFRNLSPERARQLGSKYELDYMITEQELALPLAVAAGSLRIYHLR